MHRARDHKLRNGPSVKKQIRLDRRDGCTAAITDDDPRVAVHEIADTVIRHDGHRIRATLSVSAESLRIAQRIDGNGLPYKWTQL